MSLSERFWAKVDKNGPVHPRLGTRCWLWTAARSPRGYGKFGVNGKNSYAHRVAYLVLTGKSIPDALRVCHHCDNPPCVNPEHHFIGQQRDNVHDSLAKGRFRNANMKKTHCGQGHEFTPENTQIDRSGYRKCRECNRRWCLDRYYRKRRSA